MGWGKSPSLFVMMTIDTRTESIRKLTFWVMTGSKPGNRAKLHQKMRKIFSRCLSKESAVNIYVQSTLAFNRMLQLINNTATVLCGADANLTEAVTNNNATAREILPWHSKRWWESNRFYRR